MNNMHTKTEKILIAFFYFILITICLMLPYFAERKQGLTIYTYADMVPKEVFHDFEKKTGIPVYVKFFSSNEEMFAKLKIDKGSGYDLITPTDYMVEILHQEGLLQELELKKIPVFSQLDSRVLGKYFDPENRYSLPIAWIAYGVGFNKRFFGNQLKENSWKMIFNVPNNKKKLPWYYISMIDDGREAFFLALLYLYGNKKVLTEDEVDTVTKLLVRQWNWVENYTNSNQPFYLQSGLVPFVVVQSDLMWRILQDNDQFGFSIPQEGSIMTIESLVIPKTCSNRDAAHQLINHILSADSLLKTTLMYGYSPSNKKSIQQLKKIAPTHIACSMTDEQFKQMHVLDNEMSIEMYSEIWLKVKSTWIQKTMKGLEKR